MQKNKDGNGQKDKYHRFFFKFSKMKTKKELNLLKYNILCFFSFSTGDFNSFKYQKIFIITKRFRTSRSSFVSMFFYLFLLNIFQIVDDEKIKKYFLLDNNIKIIINNVLFFNYYKYVKFKLTFFR